MIVNESYTVENFPSGNFNMAKMGMVITVSVLEYTVR